MTPIINPTKKQRELIIDRFGWQLKAKRDNYFDINPHVVSVCNTLRTLFGDEAIKKIYEEIPD